MNTYLYFFSLFFLFFIIYYSEYMRKKGILKTVEMRKRKGKNEEIEMIDVVSKYMNTNVVIKTIDSAYVGKLLRIEDNWIVVNEGTKKGENTINLDYVTSIKPYKGKLK